MIDRTDAWRTALACMWYVSNRPFEEFFAAIFGDEARHPQDPYKFEWASRWGRRNFSEIFGHLDYRHQQVFIAAVLDKYESDTEKTLKAAESRRA